MLFRSHCRANADAGIDLYRISYRLRCCYIAYLPLVANRPLPVKVRRRRYGDRLDDPKNSASLRHSPRYKHDRRPAAVRRRASEMTSFAPVRCPMMRETATYRTTTVLCAAAVAALPSIERRIQVSYRRRDNGTQLPRWRGWNGVVVEASDGRERVREPTDWMDGWADECYPTTRT